jgi:hypothetical protein
MAISNSSDLFMFILLSLDNQGELFLRFHASVSDSASGSKKINEIKVTVLATEI